MALDPVSAVLEVGGKLIDRLWPDPVQTTNAKLELVKMQQAGDLQVMVGQMSVNAEEAKSASVFTSGWRPFIGWVCGTACAWNWVGISVLNSVTTVFGYNVVLKMTDISDMLPILLGMLGLGGLRTLEKINGVAAK